MWAVQVKVDTSAVSGDPREMLEREVVPHAKSAPGFVRGVWAQHEGRQAGFGLLIVDTEEHARAVAGTLTVGSPAGGGATVQGVELYEVMAEA